MDPMTFPRQHGSLLVKLDDEGWQISYTAESPAEDPIMSELVLYNVVTGQVQSTLKNTTERRLDLPRLLMILSESEARLLLGYVVHVLDQAWTHVDYADIALSEAISAKRFEAIHDLCVEMHNCMHLIEYAHEAGVHIVEGSPALESLQ